VTGSAVRGVWRYSGVGAVGERQPGQEYQAQDAQVGGPIAGVAVEGPGSSGWDGRQHDPAAAGVVLASDHPALGIGDQHDAIAGGPDQRDSGWYIG